MSDDPKEPRELTRKQIEKIQERHFRRVWPYYEKLEVRRILAEMDRQREAMKAKDGGGNL